LTVNHPKLSVLIVSHKVNESLAAVLHALNFQTLSPAYFEIILVLDGCELTSTLREASAGLTRLCVISTKEPSGRSRARNIGLSKVSTAFTVSLDGDMIPHPTLLQTYCEIMFENPCVCIGRRGFSLSIPNCKDFNSIGSFEQYLRQPSYKADYRQNFLEKTEFLTRAAEPFWALSTCNCSYPTDSAVSCGGFDECIKGWGLEDQEFGYRLWQKGLEFKYIDEAYAVHLEHHRDKQLEYLSWMNNRQYCISKHGALFSRLNLSMTEPLLIDSVTNRSELSDVRDDGLGPQRVISVQRHRG